MRIRIEVQSALDKFILPQGYNPYVQGLVNACIPEDIKWSGIATGTEEAHFKLFTFSQLYAKSVERIDIAPRDGVEADGHVHYQLVMSSPAWFYLSSPSPEFIEALVPRLEQAHDLHLERNLVQSVRVVAAYPVTIPTHGLVTWRIRTISPITVYQSEGKDNNSAHYFAPDDPLFAKLVLDNAVRKYYAWTQEKAPSDGFSISCLDHTPHLAVISFKDTPVHGYTGRFQLTGDAKLLSFLYESGLGGKNSHGFGMFDIAPEGEDDAHWHRRTEEDTREVHRTPPTPMAAADQERPGRHERSDSRGQEGHVWHGEHHSATGESSSSRSTGSRDDRTHASRPHLQGEHSDRPYSDRPHTERSASDRPHTDRPYSDRARTDRPYSDRPKAEGPRLDGTPGTSRGTGRPGKDSRGSQASPRGGSSDHRGPRGTEEPRRKFVSRYAPDIKPVSHEKAATGSYSIWDGKAKTELPRFVRPDGTESTGGPRPNEHRGGPRPGVSGRSSSGDARSQSDRRGGSFGASRPGGSPGSVHRPSGGHGDPRDHRGSKGGPYNH
ncbi:CRISPR-associated endoribonuclease Cas6 [Candidatus Cryosericum terrychapinii]|uniref:CRISPR-associated endoribonuclease Cas6 n=1 Tax=Candidatus Cryosericum terrychapinii TaxID=2290919 RepID=A0A398CXF7_9BACT|nr:CRISPR-associated endoribonuclease Cas6 [Candidatus Cryosericum terrychapinii]RIE05969.1 CRISPR-associated endoribonuclease Cas6 [Candidatus Cryosericum terrychapinii]